MAIKKIELVWISVEDFEQAKRFFEDILGLTVRGSEDEVGWAELVGTDGGTVLGIAAVDEKTSSDKPGQNAIVAFTVDNIIKTKKMLEKRGISFPDGIIEVPGHVKMIFFSDPDGNKYQLIEDINEDDE